MAFSRSGSLGLNDPAPSCHLRRRSRACEADTDGMRERAQDCAVKRHIESLESAVPLFDRCDGGVSLPEASRKVSFVPRHLFPVRTLFQKNMVAYISRLGNQITL